ncbi:hypothetical protein Poli38472_001992 [Pythium oligandrum]|uniref:Cytochrome b-c1 complex subunit 9 n=1 Tax=Pythium oligandrum TaxID=41045 RepID=A0A8K1CWE2_PYTOL|nr:hypothetical protein Poli38472_001992 [Pythium oligandrum]|eukprot:TMW69836.1 hypothetical protein Poli38472_001992 [Pythium oligandrum]
MLARSIRQSLRAQARMASTKSSSVNGPGALDTVYRVFMKNNVTYVTTVVAAAVVVEAVYGNTTTYIWESLNRGRLYHHVDWTQFKTDDDDEEEEDDDE